tara:strand:+ start:6102 stop:6647 length:546 start_codon:yes stop_codon:yes gene_type:complete
MSDLKRTKKVLNLYAKKVIRDARNELSRQKKNTSGELSKSLGYVITEKNKSLNLEFVGVSYAKFVDQGMQGARSSFKAPMSPYRFGTGSSSGSWKQFTSSLDKWIVKKGLAGIRDEKGRFVSRKSLRFLIQRSIYLYGIKPSYFFTNPFNVSKSTLPKQIANSYVQDAMTFLEQMNKQKTK